MSQPPNTQHGRHAPPEPVYNITDADTSRSVEQHSRMVKYTISMSVRMACFVAAFFSSGPLQWIFLAGAIFLPWVAVVIANGGSDQSRRVASTSLLDEAPRDALGAGSPAGGPAGGTAAGEAAGADATGSDAAGSDATGSGAAGSDATGSNAGTTEWHRRSGRGDHRGSPRPGDAPGGDPDDAPLVLEGELVEGDPPEPGPGPEPRPAAGPAAPRGAGE